jgi:hypothetical protein
MDLGDSNRTKVMISCDHGNKRPNKQVISETATNHKSKPVRIRYLLAGIFPSLFLAALLVPMFYGDVEYIRSYLFLFAVACVTGIVGVKRKLSRYVTAATALLWTAPFLPIIVMVIAEIFLR